jgi:transposase
VKGWRHLDLGGVRCRIECRLRRLYCPGCGDVYELVPWARAGSPYTRDFEDLWAFLAQQMNQTAVSRLMRIAWRTSRRSTAGSRRPRSPAVRRRAARPASR